MARYDKINRERLQAEHVLSLVTSGPSLPPGPRMPGPSRPPTVRSEGSIVFRNLY